MKLKSYEYRPEAVKNLFLIERENPQQDVVLTTVKNIVEAKKIYSNYFGSSAKDFIKILNKSIDDMKSKDKELPK